MILSPFTTFNTPPLVEVALVVAIELDNWNEPLNVPESMAVSTNCKSIVLSLWSTEELGTLVRVLAYKIFPVAPFTKPLDTLPVEEPEGYPTPFSFWRIISAFPLLVELGSNVLCLLPVAVFRYWSTNVTTMNVLGPEVPVISVAKLDCVYVVKPI